MLLPLIIAENTPENPPSPGYFHVCITYNRYSNLIGLSSFTNGVVSYASKPIAAAIFNQECTNLPRLIAWLRNNTCFPAGDQSASEQKKYIPICYIIEE